MAMRLDTLRWATIRGSRVLPALLLACVTAGCGSTYYNVAQVQEFLQQPRSPVSATEYHVYPPDVIAISSAHVPEIGGITQRIRPDGRINLPLLGEVFVAGKTPAQIRDALREAALDFYEEARDITVDVVGYNSQFYYVFGHVGGPGPAPWTGRDSLLDALARAQPTELAWPERIWVVRGSGPQVGGVATSMPSSQYRLFGVQPAGASDEPPRRMLVNMMAMVKSGDLSSNILLQPNDVIYVQANPFAKIGLALDQFFWPIRSLNTGFSDYREFADHIHWIEDGMPREGEDFQGTQNVRIR